MKLRDILLSIYEGKYEKRDGESDEDFLSRIANSGMMTGSRGYVLQKGVTDYRSEGKDMYTGEDDTDCVRADGESDEDYLSRCANRNFTPSSRLFGKTPSDSVSKPLILRPKP